MEHILIVTGLNHFLKVNSHRIRHIFPVRKCHDLISNTLIFASQCIGLYHPIKPYTNHLLSMRRFAVRKDEEEM